jgi:hypothetical protein
MSARRPALPIAMLLTTADRGLRAVKGADGSRAAFGA